MTKLSSLGLLIATVFTLGGCSLYFGRSDDGGQYNYCGSDGYYNCTGDGACTLVSATCPSDPNGPTCTTNADCAAGCFCQNGQCEEAGFCDPASTDPAQCPEGMHCDDRSSCVPDECSDTTPCPAGEVCTGGTCQPDPATCQGDIAPTCNLTPPKCDAGSVATMVDGCYDGGCRAITSCDGPSVCSHLQHQEDCASRNEDCGQVFIGINCTKPDGSACQMGDTGCTCASFKYDRCEAK